MEMNVIHMLEGDLAIVLSQASKNLPIDEQIRVVFSPEQCYNPCIQLQWQPSSQGVEARRGTRQGLRPFFQNGILE